METNTFFSDLAIHPGEFLLETLDELGMSQSELADRLGRPYQAVNEIIHGKKSITPKTALALEDVLGIPAHIWTGLDAEYQMIMARQEEVKQLEQETECLPLFPFTDLLKLGLVAPCKKPTDKVEALKGFFGVAKLSQISQVKSFQPAFRISHQANISNHAVAAWLEAARKLTEKVETMPFDKEKLKHNLPTLKGLVTLPFEAAIEQAESVLKQCGVALVLLPHFKKTPVQGATFWLSDSKAVIAMTIRGAFADIFWFSFFHEVGHVLLHGQRKVFLEDGFDDPELRTQEQEANRFAQDTLLPKKMFEHFLQQNDFSESAILNFATNVSTSPDIVIGRLKYEKRLHPSMFNQFKRKIALPF